MPAYKDSKTGTWFVKFYCKDWTGENKQIKKRGFATKREALDYERNYKIRQENNLDMTFGEFWNRERDDEVNKRLLFEGWNVIRFWGDDIKKHTDECVKVVEEAIFDLNFDESEDFN